MIYGSFTTSELINEVKKRAFLPSAQAALDSDDILGYINTELYDSLVPHVLQYHQEYFGAIEPVALVVNQDNYKIPYRAIGRKLRDIKYSDESGNLYPMTRILPEDRNYFQATGFNPYKSFYFQGDEIILIPGVGETPTGNLIMAIFMRPNLMVDESRAAVVTAFDEDTGIINVSAIPSNLSAGSLADFIEAHPGHKLLNYDVTITGIDTVSNTITISTDDFPSHLAVGDYINTAGESILPQIPQELQSLLAERAAARCLASLGHTENLNEAQKKIQELEFKSGSLIDNRSEGSPIKLNNLGGLLRLSKVGRRRFYF